MIKQLRALFRRDPFPADAFVKIYFKPKPDITAYELAQILSKVRDGFLYQEIYCDKPTWDNMVYGLKRHFCEAAL